MVRPIIKITCWFMLLGVFISQPLLYAQLPEKVELDAGASRVLQADFNIETIAVGDPEILGCVKVRDQELLINAKTAGQTNIFVWGKGDRQDQKAEIQVIVRSRGLETTATEIREAVKNIEGVTVRVTGNRVFVEGAAFSHNDFKRIETVIKDMPNVVNLVELSPVMKEIVKGEIDKALAAQGFKNVSVSVTQNNFMLSGQVSSADESNRAQRIAQAYSPDIVNAIAVRAPASQPRYSTAPGAAAPAAAAPAPQRAARPILIEMSVDIMEIEKNALRDFGVHWNPGGSLGAGGNYSSATGQSPTLSGSVAGTLSNLLPKMRKLNETGQGRSLMQQTLITKSGDSADLFAGSEVPIPVAQDGGTMSVQYKKIGVKMNFQPTIDSYNNIISSISIESSSITGQGPGGAPTISTTNLNTVLSVASGQSIALGGMVGQRDVSAISGSPPGGGDALFQANKSTRKGTDSREVLIFVTPRILSTEPVDTKDMQKKVEGEFKEQELEKLREQAK